MNNALNLSPSLNPQYDPIGNLTNVAYPVSSSISYAYDDLNRLISMADGIGTTTFSWTDGDQLQSETGPWAQLPYPSTILPGFSLSRPSSELGPSATSRS